ncbi:MAG: ribose transport system ATP-binding protein [Rhodospirillaceae bacterium]|nr:ribose transport system ATP-binding protein [Rhodospirillaceae bacterium]
MAEMAIRDGAKSRGLRPAGQAGALVEVRNISKRFGATRALRDVSLSFQPGEIHCLLGENGAGKSTVGKIIGGVYDSDDGEVRLDGTRALLRSVADARAAGVAVVFQELSLALDLTVRENICLGTERRRHPLDLLRRKDEEQRCGALLRELDVSINLSARVGDLAVANQQMVEIAKAMLLRPRVLILDEPTAMLGAVEKVKLFEILRRLKAEGTTFVFITHHIEEVIEIGDRVSIMKDGALVDSFPIDSSISADFVVEKLAGKQVSRTRSARRTSAMDDVLSIANLPGREGAHGEICVRRGEIVGLYGVVGCGRERIVRALVGLDDLLPATIALNGATYRPRDPAAAARQGVAYLPSGRASNCILPTRSIKENLLLTQLRKFHRAGFLANAAERDAGLEQLAQLRTRFASQEDPITRLSGGNQQKVVLGRCLGHASRLLILEDPTAGIDIAAKQEIHDLMRARADDGLAILFVSSDLAETLLLSDVVYTIFKGRVCGEYRPPGPADEPAILADVLGSADGSSAFSPISSAQVQHATR